MNSYFAGKRSASRERQIGCPRIHAIGRHCGNGQRIISIRQRKPKTKASIFPQPNFSVADSYHCVLLGASINDEFGIDSKPE
jgi:hypothetical protein